MKKNSDNFSMEDARRLAQSSAGQQLLDIIRRTDSGRLKQAAALVSQGNPEQAKQCLSELLNDPQVAALLAQLGGK